jgi:hypothetical protein
LDNLKKLRILQNNLCNRLINNEITSFHLQKTGGI